MEPTMLTRKLKEAVALAPPHHRHPLLPHLLPRLLTVLTLKRIRKRGTLSYLRLNSAIIFLKENAMFVFCVFFLIFTGNWQVKGRALPLPLQMRKRLRTKGMERGAQHSSEVLFADHCLSSQCCKARQGSSRLAESFSLA